MTFPTPQSIYPHVPSGHMTTWTGRVVNPMDLKPADVSIYDIAHSLSMQCRYNGHSGFYSVAEHSVHVAHGVLYETQDRLLALTGLLHDATETYVGDMIRPLKEQMPEFVAAEERIADVIAVKFGIRHPLPDVVKAWDNHMVVIERIAFREIGGLEPAEAEDAFMEAFASYKGRP